MLIGFVAKIRFHFSIIHIVSPVRAYFHAQIPSIRCSQPDYLGSCTWSDPRTRDGRAPVSITYGSHSCSSESLPGDNAQLPLPPCGRDTASRGFADRVMSP